MPQLRHRAGDLIDNRYEVRKILGSGAFGTVYGCQDTELGIPVAVKELHVLDEREGDGERERALAEFRSEAIHLSKLKHPHIVSGHYEPHTGVWQVCPVCGLDFPPGKCPTHGAMLREVASRHYLVMEYIAGPDLLQMTETREGSIEWEEIEPTVLEVAGALAYIHARGFVHRDIKPENIRLRADTDEAVLLDFGIAVQGESSDNRYGTRSKRQTQGGGTLGYAPPATREQRRPDARSDVHAFGMTLYHLLTGLDPTDAESERQMRSEEPCDFVPEMSDALNDLILDCIDYEPQNRPQDGAQLLERLELLSDASPSDEIARDDGSDHTVVLPAQGAMPPVAPSSFALVPPIPPVAAVPSSPVAPATQRASAAPPLVYRSGHQVVDVSELAYMVDHEARETTEKLLAGEIESFLLGLGQSELAGRVARVRVQGRNQPAHALEHLAQLIGLAPPTLHCAPDALHFGGLAPDSQRKSELVFVNEGRGLLFGSVRASHPAIKTYGHWEGNRAKVPVTFDAHRLAPGVYRGEIAIDSSAGDFVMPFEARVSGPSWWPPFLTVVLYGAGGLVLGGALRVLPFALAAAKKPPLDWLSATTKISWWPTAPLFGVVIWAALLAWTTIESTWRRSCSAWLTFGSLALLLGVGAGIGGLEALRGGDAYLKSYTFHWVGHFAPGGWMVAGAGAGALLGSLRRIKDWFSLRILAIVLGILATGVLVKLALLGALQNGLKP